MYFFAPLRSLCILYIPQTRFHCFISFGMRRIPICGCIGMFWWMLFHTIVSIIYWEILIMALNSPHPPNQCCVHMFTQQVAAYIFQHMLSTSRSCFKYHFSIDLGAWGAVQEHNVKKTLILLKFSNILETIVRICWNWVHFEELVCKCT